KDITVAEAYKMIKKARGNLVILDVRNQSEYTLGHLYGAVLIPVYELEERISELQEHVDDPIIVYCKAGSRSPIACQILASHGFTKVYNMLGGILAWIKAGYPIVTASPVNYILTVTLRDHGAPFYELTDFAFHYLSEATICPAICHICPSSPSTSEISLVTEENTVILKVDDTEMGRLIVENFEILLNVSEINDESKRETMLMQMKLHIVQNGEMDETFTFYELIRSVTAPDFKAIIITVMVVSDALEEYISFFTLMNYAPSEGKKMFYGDAIIINSSVTLSKHYDLIAKSLRFLKAHIYQGESELSTIMSEAYIKLASELHRLSKFVQKNLAEYNVQTTLMGSSALAFDGCYEDCSIACAPWAIPLCGLGCIPVAGACGPFYWVCYPACLAACGAGWGAFCTWLCSWLCGQELNVKKLGCGAVCGAICAFCPAETYLAACFVCSLACEQVCNSIFR
ncbi:MAG: rhodanese-like domain-containing protein, partial [Candidatus Bathyarchaeia archaeon]